MRKFKFLIENLKVLFVFCFVLLLLLEVTIFVQHYFFSENCCSKLLSDVWYSLWVLEALLKYIVIFLSSLWLQSPRTMCTRCYNILHSCSSCMGPDKVSSAFHRAPRGCSCPPEGHLLEGSVGMYLKDLPGDHKLHNLTACPLRSCLLQRRELPTNLVGRLVLLAIVVSLLESHPLHTPIS